MADKKISALTSATTPLAGTEVLPIVQSGATVKVPVSSLTAGRDVSMKKITATGDAFLGTDNNSNKYYFGTFTNLAGGANSAYLAPGLADVNEPTNFMLQARDAAGDLYNVLKVGSDWNVTAMLGNLVIGTAGKGIDFSADPSAAGMTSELLDDYEEGTFTCTMTASSSGTITINSGYRTGKYTKIGRQVNVCGFLVIDSVSSPVGAASINGLPFACGPNDSNLSAASFEIRSSAFPAGASVQGRIESNQTGFSVSSFASGTIADAAAYITGGTQITFNLTYFVN